HGAVRADSHRELPVDRRPFPDLVDDLAPYRRLIEGGLPAVMMAHVEFPEVDARPASFSSRWIRGVLREDLHFQGAVFSDDLSMGGAARDADIVERAERVLAAGCDVVPVCNDRAAVVSLLERLHVEPHPASQARLVRMRGRGGLPFAELRSGAEWREAHDRLVGLAAPPLLALRPGAP
ncbi:MAG: glycoside hydrolase family 3 N-terminal domain-containing protein, partial [Steroidobacteraceae bacterium]